MAGTAGSGRAAGVASAAAVGRCEVALLRLGVRAAVERGGAEDGASGDDERERARLRR